MRVLSRNDLRYTRHSRTSRFYLARTICSLVSRLLQMVGRVQRNHECFLGVYFCFARMGGGGASKTTIHFLPWTLPRTRYGAFFLAATHDLRIFGKISSSNFVDWLLPERCLPLPPSSRQRRPPPPRHRQRHRRKSRLLPSRRHKRHRRKRLPQFHPPTRRNRNSRPRPRREGIIFRRKEISLFVDFVHGTSR